MVYKCPKCKSKKFWQLSDGRLKCVRCKQRFSRLKNKPFIEPKLLRKVIEEFLLEHSTNIILARVKISKYKLLKVLTLLRIVMTKDIPEVFSGIVEVDETYLGGQMKNKRKQERCKLGKNRRGFGTVKQPVFGILCRQGKVYAEVVPDIEAKDLQPLIEKQVKKGSTICSDGWRAYTGLAAKGYVHRLVDHSKNEYSDKKGNHINGLEGFWGYLKRKLAAKGGIRRERLPLYLGEYVWRFNHRKLPLKEQENLLFKLFLKHFRSK
jgi:transposase-like protein/DNA-directed RNA polymerase subunit RPC12/RpoP